jgi:protein O-GlcNAc transferase
MQSDTLVAARAGRDIQTALQHHNAGRFSQAEAIYRQILEYHPQCADALHWLGVIAQQSGDLQTAVARIREALTLKPAYAEAHYNLGFALQAQGQLEAAAASYDRAIAFKPDFAEAYFNLGNVLKLQGHLEQAIARYRQALTFRLSYAAAYNNLGNTLRQQGRLDEAIACFNNALHFNPDAPDLHNNLGVALQAHGKLEAAAVGFQRALALRPDYAEAHQGLGAVLQMQGQRDQAIACFREAVRCKPDYAVACNSLGLLYRKQGYQDEALQCFQQALALQPDFAEAAYNIHDVQLHSSKWTHYSDNVEKIHQAVHTGLGRQLPFAFLAISQSPAAELQCARIYASEHYPASEMPVWKGERYRHDKIRVAYLSADFHNHATAYLMAGLFEAHDKERFEVTALSYGPDSQSEMRQRLQPAFDRFVDVRQMSDRDIALLMRAWEIDIAVDLKGYTTEGRPGILAQRAAPVQVAYLGYPGTMGANYIDYVLADASVIPPEDRIYYTEQVVCLPDTYQVNDDKRRIADTIPTRVELNLPENGFVFCCFNNNYKITPALFDCWMRLLRKVDGSVLWLLGKNPAVERNLRQEAVSRGVEGERLVFAAPIVLERHLARLTVADLFLDTLPYNAHTTASDALWAGTPLLTCTGNTFAGRVAGSLLRAIGLPELITPNLEAYENLALHLATTPVQLAEIREKLVKNRASYPLFDTERFRRNIEAAYTGMWERHQKGNPPESFSIP